MSERIGVCGGCGMKFKVPDTFQGAQAKCKKCGGIVTISAASAAQAPAKPAPAAAKPAPAKAAPAAAAKPTAKPGMGAPKPAAGKAAAAPVGKAGAGRSAGRAAKAGAGASRKGGAAPKKDNTMMIVGIAAAVLVIGGGAFFMMKKGDADADAANEATKTATATSGENAAPEVAPPPVIDAPPVVDPTPAPVEAPPEETTKAPEPTPEPPAELPSVIEFPAIDKPGVVTDEQWTAAQDAVRVAYIESSRPKQRGEAMKVLAEQRVAAIGAMINALNGLDLAQERSFNTAGVIVKGIQTVSFDVIKIPFRLDVLEMADNVQFNAKCIQNLAKYWTKEMANPEKFAEKLQTAMDKPPEDEGN